MIIHNRHTQSENGKLSPSKKTNSIKMIILSIDLFVSFALIVTWQVLVPNFQVTRLCSMMNMSSQQVSPYLFRAFVFCFVCPVVDRRIDWVFHLVRRFCSDHQAEHDIDFFETTQICQVSHPQGVENYSPLSVSGHQ